MAQKLIFPFDFDQTLESACFLLNQTGRTMNYMLLLKLLYLADRKYLCTYGETITGDTPYAMKNGPVLSHIYSLIKNDRNFNPIPEEYFTRWQKYIVPASEPYSVQLKADPGTGNLCRAGIKILTEIFQSYADKNPFDLSELTHKLNEWIIAQKNLNSSQRSVPINWADVLCDEPEMIPVAEENIRMKKTSSALLGTEK